MSRWTPEEEDSTGIGWIRREFEEDLMRAPNRTPEEVRQDVERLVRSVRGARQFFQRPKFGEEFNSKAKVLTDERMDQLQTFVYQIAYEVFGVEFDGVVKE
ncbi:MAG: hypothetical protein ABIA47_01530 [bacterium]